MRLKKKYQSKAVRHNGFVKLTLKMCVCYIPAVWFFQGVFYYEHGITINTFSIEIFSAYVLLTAGYILRGWVDKK